MIAQEARPSASTGLQNTTAQAGTPSAPTVAGSSNTQGGASSTVTQSQTQPSSVPPASIAPTQYLLTDEQAQQVFSPQAKTGPLQALGDALDLGEDHKSKPKLQRQIEIVRLLGTSTNPEFNMSTGTFSFPDLCKQDFPKPATQPQA